MSVTKLELPPLRKTKCSPALLVTGESEDVIPANRLFSPADRFCHRFPHRNHDGGKNQIVGLRDEVFACAGPRLRVAKLDEGRGSWTNEISLTRAAQDEID